MQVLDSTTDELVPSPVLTRMKERGCKRGKRVTGYVGAVEDDRVLVHPSLETQAYLELPTAAVLHSSKLAEGRYEFLVDAQARVRWVEEGTLDASSSEPAVLMRWPLTDELCSKATGLLARAERILGQCLRQACSQATIRELREIIHYLRFDVLWEGCNVNPYVTVEHGEPTLDPRGGTPSRGGALASALHTAGLAPEPRRDELHRLALVEAFLGGFESARGHDEPLTPDGDRADGCSVGA